MLDKQYETRAKDNWNQAYFKAGSFQGIED